jgi:hypothetical protein
VPAVDDLVAGYASEWCMRAYQRRDVEVDGGAGVRWSIEGDALVDLEFPAHGPARLLVRDVTLVRPLRRRLRTRHVVIAYEPVVEIDARG